jgi:hypothetical protein
MLTLKGLRRLISQVTGRDPGPLSDDTILGELLVAGPARYELIAVIENDYDIEFPADLLTVLETVGDLAAFTNVKASQARE